MRNPIAKVVSISGLLLLGGCELLFPRQAGSSLSHFADAAPQPGEPAPGFSLRDLEGRTVALDDLVGSKPIVVQLGSFTCPVFRYRRFDMIPLRERYADKVTFIVVYTLEAHPVGTASPYRDEEWVPWINRLARVLNEPHSDSEARRLQAQLARQRMSSNARFLIDGMDDRTWSSYGRAHPPLT